MSDAPLFAYVLLASRTEMLTSGPTPIESSVIEHHFKYLSDLTASGSMLFVGRTLTSTPDTFGIAVFRAASEAEAYDVMNNVTRPAPWTRDCVTRRAAD